MLRCKRCFKKYDGYDPECPRCGKLNEIEDIPRDSQEVETTRSNAHAYGESKERISFKAYRCKFCGSLHTGNATNCTVCFNSKVVGKKAETQTIDPYKFERFIDDAYRENTNVIDFKKIFHDAELLKIDLNLWEAPVSYEFGKLFSWKKLFMMSCSFIFFLFIGQIKRYDSIVDALPFVLIYLVIGIIVMLFKKKTYVEGLNISKITSRDEAQISCFESKDGKRGDEKFNLYSFDIDSVELITNDSNDIIKVNLNEKKTEDKEAETYTITTNGYTDSNSFKKVILLFCFKYNIRLSSKNENDFTQIQCDEII